MPVPDRWTDRLIDRWINIMVIAQRFVLTNTLSAKNNGLNAVTIQQLALNCFTLTVLYGGSLK